MTRKNTSWYLKIFMENKKRRVRKNWKNWWLRGNEKKNKQELLNFEKRGFLRNYKRKRRLRSLNRF